MSAPTSGQLRVERKPGGHYHLIGEQGMVVAVTSWKESLDQANAERIARCWNAHQGLVEALEEQNEAQREYD